MRWWLIKKLLKDDERMHLFCASVNYVGKLEEINSESSKMMRRIVSKLKPYTSEDRDASGW